MPSNYIGNPAGIGQRDLPEIACPVDGEPRNAASVNDPLQTLADFVAFLQSQVAFRYSLDPITFPDELNAPNGPLMFGGQLERNIAATFAAGAGLLRLYYGPDGLEVTRNAKWDVVTSRWVRDSTSEPSTRWWLRSERTSEPGGILVQVMSGPEADFADAGWTDRFVLQVPRIPAENHGAVLGVSVDVPGALKVLGSGVRRRRIHVGQPGSPGFLNGWDVLGGHGLSFYTDAFNTVHFVGGASTGGAGTGQNKAIFQIPSGQGRPVSDILVPVTCVPGIDPAETHQLHIQADGHVLIPTLRTGTSWTVHLSHVQYAVGLGGL